MTRYSKTLERLAESDPRISEYEYDPGNDCGAHWLHLKWPWICALSGGGSVHQDTVKECIEALAMISDDASPAAGNV